LSKDAVATFLRSECDRLGLTALDIEFLCSYQIARQALPEPSSHALGSLASKLQLPFTPAQHRAAVDAGIVASVILEICERLQAESLRPIGIAALRRLATAEECAALASAA
jgi:DNA polymerase III epsilon subunit-like protein